MRNNKIILVLLILMSAYTFSYSQSVVLQVVTKRINKSFVYVQGDKLIINGSKAEVEISTWDKDLIKLEFVVVAKHPDKSVAESDLSKMKQFILIVVPVVCSNRTLFSGLPVALFFFSRAT